MVFIKGKKSANPNGRGIEKPFLDALRLEVADGGNQKKLRRIAKKLLDEAMKGEAWAVNMVADRLDGKAIQTIDATVTDERSFNELATNELLTRVDGALTRIAELEAGTRGTGKSEGEPADLRQLN